MIRNQKTANIGIFAIRRGELFAAIVAASVVALVASSASAYQTRLNEDCSVALHWPPGEVVRFSLNRNGCGDDLTFDECKAAVLAAFDTVQNIDCTGIQFEYAGETTSNIYRHNPIDTADGINLIVWYESWPPDTGISDISIASTWSLRNHLGEFTEFGIALNGDTYRWANDLSSDAQDVQGVITAQILYVLGLAESDSEESILDGIYAYGSDRKRSPLQDDIDGVCYLAPDDPDPDHWNTECPAGQHCEIARCVPGAPPADDSGSVDAADSDTGTPSTSSDAGDTPSRDAAIEPKIDAAPQRDATSGPLIGSEDANSDTAGTTESDGGRRAECQFNSDCVDGRICTDGKCVEPEDGDGDGCGCRVGRVGPSSTPIVPLLLLLVCARILRKPKTVYKYYE